MKSKSYLSTYRVNNDHDNIDIVNCEDSDRPNDGSSIGKQELKNLI